MPDLSVLSNVPERDPNAEKPQVWEGTILDSPVTWEDRVRVEGDDRRYFDGCSVARQGLALPKAGARCVVGESDDGEFWVLNWQGDDGMPALAAGEGLVWNGTKWVANGGEVTSLPATPFHGQEITYRNPGGDLWRFRYNANYVGAHKWEFIGGSPMIGLNSTGAAFVGLGGGFQTLPTLFNVPLEGFYSLAGSIVMTQTNTAGVAVAGMGVFGLGLAMLPLPQNQAFRGSGVYPHVVFPAKGAAVAPIIFASGFLLNGSWDEVTISITPFRVI